MTNTVEFVVNYFANATSRTYLITYGVGILASFLLVMLFDVAHGAYMQVMHNTRTHASDILDPSVLSVIVAMSILWPLLLAVGATVLVFYLIPRFLLYTVFRGLLVWIFTKIRDIRSYYDALVTER